MNKQIYFLVFIFLIFSSCENRIKGFRFSNFNDTQAEILAKAVKGNDIRKIREEILDKKIDVNFIDKKYGWHLLSLAIANNKKKSFKQLLELGADPNLYGSNCESPLILAINMNLDLYFLKTLLVYNANVTPHFFLNKCDFFAYDPILETILNFNDKNSYKYGLKVLRLLTKKVENLNLNEFNNSKNYEHNIICFCLKTRNISALKYLIVDLKLKIPEKIFIDGTVLLNSYGYMSLKEILQNKTFIFEHSPYREKAKQEILAYLNKKE